MALLGSAMVHDIPPLIVSGLFSLGAATVTGLLGWFGGDRSGVEKGRVQFINAVREAAELVIGELKESMQRVTDHADQCEAELAEVRQHIDDIMSGRVPLYHLNKDRFDG